MLCENPFVLPGSPSTCTIDVALVPLPSFLLLFFGALVVIRLPHDHSRPVTVPRWVRILYMALVVAAIAMTILELIRDAVDHMGVGLIPVVVVGLSLVFVRLSYEMKHRRGSRSLSVLVLIYWLLNIVFQSIKVERLKKLVQLDPGRSKYPSSDQLLDNAVILGLYVAFVFFEISIWLSAIAETLADSEVHDPAQAENKPTTA